MAGKKSILIIEDHQALRSMLTELFTIAGYEVNAVINGQEGLKAAQRGGYAAIICDIKMPLMDGITFLKAMQANPPKAKNGPVVMYSNFAYQYSKDEVLSLGAADFIAKDTLGSYELVNHVEKLINNPNSPTVAAHDPT